MAKIDLNDYLEKLTEPEDRETVANRAYQRELFEQYVTKDGNFPEQRAQLLEDFRAGKELTGPKGLRRKLGAFDLEYFGRAYLAHYFVRPSPKFHGELDRIWREGVLKGMNPELDAKRISRADGRAGLCRCAGRPAGRSGRDDRRRRMERRCGRPRRYCGRGRLLFRAVALPAENRTHNSIYNNKNLMEVLLYTILTLCALGVFSAVILYFVARKFRVEEDPRIDEVEKMLPGANCGGCGFAGCRGMADALVKRDDISALFCPVGGGDCMKAVAAYLGKAAAEKQPEVATVRCGGTCEKRPRTNEYNGAKSCAVASSLYVGETGCAFGCLGFGDCVAVCAFDAIHINPETGLPEVDADKCTACGACVKACPKMIIELRKKWPKNRAVYVSCVSKEKGAVVMKACKAGCIGCGKCVKVCAFDAITVENNLAYIDPQKCKLCRKCVNECPTGAIRLVGMDPLPKAPKAPAAPAANKES